MTLQDQVCSLEQSKKLAELGVRQDSLFYVWHQHGESPVIPKYCFGRDEDDKVNKHYSAFTVAELGAALTDWLDEHYEEDTITVITDKYGNSIRIMFNPICLADLLIYLLENKIISIEQVNESLK